MGWFKSKESTAESTAPPDPNDFHIAQTTVPFDQEQENLEKSRRAAEKLRKPIDDWLHKLVENPEAPRPRSPLYERSQEKYYGHRSSVRITVSHKGRGVHVHCDHCPGLAATLRELYEPYYYVVDIWDQGNNLHILFPDQ